MFTDVTMTIGVGMVGAMEQDIPIPIHHSSALPGWIILSGLSEWSTLYLVKSEKRGNRLMFRSDPACDFR